MTSVPSVDCTPVLGADRLDGFTDVSEQSARFAHVDGSLQSLLGGINEPLRVSVDFSNWYCGVEITVESVNWPTG